MLNKYAISVISSDGISGRSSTITTLSPICKDRAILMPTHLESEDTVSQLLSTISDSYN